MVEPTRALDAETAAILIGAAGKSFEAELTALPEAIASWHPAPGEWCVKEVIGHVIEAERRGFAGRIREILAAHEPRLETWDQVGVARERGDCYGALAGLLSELSQLRAGSLELVKTLRPADLERGGDATFQQRLGRTGRHVGARERMTCVRRQMHVPAAPDRNIRWRMDAWERTSCGRPDLP